MLLKYSLRCDSLYASAVLMTSTYEWSSKRRAVTFWLWFSIANLKADCTSSVPCSNMAPGKKKKVYSHHTCNECHIKLCHKCWSRGNNSELNTTNKLAAIFSSSKINLKSHVYFFQTSYKFLIFNIKFWLLSTNFKR